MFGHQLKVQIESGLNTKKMLNSDSQMAFTRITQMDFGQSLGHLEEACYNEPLLTEFIQAFRICPLTEFIKAFRIWPCQLILWLPSFLHLEFDDKILASCPQSLS